MGYELIEGETEIGVPWWSFPQNPVPYGPPPPPKNAKPYPSALPPLFAPPGVALRKDWVRLFPWNPTPPEYGPSLPPAPPNMYTGLNWFERGWLAIKTMAKAVAPEIGSFAVSAGGVMFVGGAMVAAAYLKKR